MQFSAAILCVMKKYLLCSLSCKMHIQVVFAWGEDILFEHSEPDIVLEEKG